MRYGISFDCCRGGGDGSGHGCAVEGLLGARPENHTRVGKATAVATFIAFMVAAGYTLEFTPNIASAADATTHSRPYVWR